MSSLRQLPLLFVLATGCGTGPGAADTDTEDTTELMDPGQDPDAEDPAPDDISEQDTLDEPDPPCVLPSSTCISEPCHTGPFSTTCMGGHVIDDTGAPIAEQGVAICASSMCFGGLTDSTGWFAVAIPSTPIDSVRRISLPSMNRKLSPFCDISTLCDGPVHLCHPFVLHPAPTTGISIPDTTLTEDLRIEADDTAALVIHTGAEVHMPVVDRFMALTPYPLASDTPCFVDPETPPIALYVVTPLDSYLFEPDTTTTLPASLDLPNTTSLPVGTTLDVRVLGGQNTEHVGFDEADFPIVATATVDASGRIVTSPGEGIGYLTWFGLTLP